MIKMSYFGLLMAIAVCILPLSGCHQPASPPSTDTPSATAGDEWRGVWLSYLDLCQLLEGTSPTAAAAALDNAMDTCADAGLREIVFHVRSHSDAWYQSTLFPAADAAAPLLAAGFDPLDYAVDAAHKRGLRLHAWINPYRIGEDADNAVLSATDSRFQHDGVWYYNPANREVQATILAGIREVLAGYAVDGIHFDDYFYPAGLTDDAYTFETVPAGMTATDYRRTHANTLVAATYGLTHCYPGRVFGISPAGDPVTGAAGGADVRTWLATPGYIDYLCPQIYFGFDHQTKAFDSLLATWAAMPRQNDVSLHIGLALYKAGLADDPYAGNGRGEWAAHSDILARQIAALRAAGADGFSLYRYAWLTSNDKTVQEELQRVQALCQ